MTKRLLLLSLVVSLTAMAPALGDTVRTQDDLAHDTHDAIDLKWVEHGHEGRKLVHVLRTYDPWPGRLLGGEGTIQINFSRSASRSSDTARVMVIYFANGHLRAKVFNVINDTVVGFADVSRPNGRTVIIVFPRWFLRHNDLRAYRYNVKVFHGNHDGLPSGSSRILHRL